MYLQTCFIRSRCLLCYCFYSHCEKNTMKEIGCSFPGRSRERSMVVSLFIFGRIYLRNLNANFCLLECHTNKFWQNKKRVKLKDLNCKRPPRINIVCTIQRKMFNGRKLEASKLLNLAGFLKN